MNNKDICEGRDISRMNKMYIIYIVYGLFLTIKKRTKNTSRFFVPSFVIHNVLMQTIIGAATIFNKGGGEVKISVSALTYTFLMVNNS